MSHIPQASQTLTLHQAARRLGCSEPTIQQLVSVEKLKAYVLDASGLLLERQPEGLRPGQELRFLAQDFQHAPVDGAVPPDEGWFLLIEDEERHPTEGSEMLLSRVRALAGLWLSLGVRAEDTTALYRPDQLTLCMDLVDRARHTIVGTLRVDHLGTSLCAARVHECRAWEEPVIEKVAYEEVIVFAAGPAGSAQGIEEAVAWLEVQVRRPVQVLE